MRPVFPRMVLALVVMLLPALFGSGASPGARALRAFEHRGSPEWAFLLPHHRDVPDDAVCYVVENDLARLVVGRTRGENNGCGSFMPGWLVDFGLTGEWHVENLDWTEWTLQPQMDRKWNHHGRWLQLPAITLENGAVVARGSWQADPRVRAEVRYTLLPHMPVARMALTLRNESDRDFKGFFQYLIDYDHGGDARVPAGAWNVNAVLPPPADNFVYAGRRDGETANFALAWYEDTPAGIVAPGYMAGLWFDASVKAGRERTLVFYQVVDTGNDDPNGRIAAWAHRIPNSGPACNAKAAVTGSLSANGAAPANAVVFATDVAGRTVARATVVHDGRYLIYLPPGNYTLHASALGHRVSA
ncbi:MAG: carboxypeptidase-like regulatory domain-containing protein, partial [Armatimonadota bacterium]|nr:carboxypeptidase-like regulatory domain-containing protein [Armatimonadota bacterium]